MIHARTPARSTLRNPALAGLALALALALPLPLVGCGTGPADEPTDGLEELDDGDATRASQGAANPSLAVGDRVVVNVTKANVRVTGNPVGAVRGTQPLGATGRVVGGPAIVGGGARWDVDFDAGVDGWVWQPFLDKAGGGRQTKWFPGHYQTIKSKAYSSGVANWTKDKFKKAIAHRNMKGYLLYINWRELEPSRGSYDLSQIEDVLAALPAGKKLQIKIQDRSFHNQVGGNMPDYVGSAGCTFMMPARYDLGAPKGTFKGAALKWWVPACVDHFIRLYQELGKRYDSDSRWAAVTVGDGESALAGAGDQTGYSTTAHYDQLIRAAREVKAAFPTTLVATGYNWLPKADADRVAQALHDLGGSAFMHPDSPVGVYFGKDGCATKNEIAYHGKVPTIPQSQMGVQTPPDMTEAEIFDWLTKTIGASMVSWGDGRYWSDPAYAKTYLNYVEDYILTFLDTNPTFPASNLACPSTAGTCISP